MYKVAVTQINTQSLALYIVNTVYYSEKLSTKFIIFSLIYLFLLEERLENDF